MTDTLTETETTTTVVLASSYKGATTFPLEVANVALFAGKDDARPVLTGVLFEVNEDGVRMVATDSYALGVQPVACEATGAHGTFLVPASWLADVGKRSAKSAVTLTFTRDRFSATVTATFADGAVLVSRCVDGDFPNYRQLMPTGDPLPTTMVGLATDQLARLSKVVDVDRGKPKGRHGFTTGVKLEWFGERKPCRGTLGNLSMLIMPYRLS